jgi:rubrerythrin
MQKHSMICALTIAAAGLWLSPAAIARTGARTGEQTLRNLQNAYNGENNARTRYLAFAEQADKEGYARVAVLFRAAARAEEIHLTNHAAVIKQLGAIPQARIEKPLVRSTKDNLEKSASKGEAYERDTMYPDFIKKAELEGLSAAVESFRYALEAETEHYNLFAAAAGHLDQMRAAGSAYYVCRVSGYTSAHRDPARCVKGEFETIN